MTAERHFSDPEKKEGLSSYDVVIPTPGYESEDHPSGLGLDTRARLFASAMFYEVCLTKKIIVGGARLRKMTNSFSYLMKSELIRKYKIPEESIETEEHTLDTASQLEWIRNNKERLGKSLLIITDSEQKKHIEELLPGFQLSDVDVLSFEDITQHLAKNHPHVTRFINNLHKSPYWFRWRIREGLLALISKTIDPKGQKIRMITGKRKQG